MNLEQVSKLESKLLLSTYERYPVMLRRGRGVYVYDDKGRRYLDFLSGIGVNAWATPIRRLPRRLRISPNC